eukprot:2930110-Pleurochrysis_carterae.AAC.1
MISGEVWKVFFYVSNLSIAKFPSVSHLIASPRGAACCRFAARPCRAVLRFYVPAAAGGSNGPLIDPHESCCQPYIHPDRIYFAPHALSQQQHR